MKKILFILMIVLCLLSFWACKNKSDEIIGKWAVGENVYEFTDDGKFIDLYNSTTAGNYKILSNQKILLYAEDMEDEGIELPYKFKDGSLYIGELEYTPFAEK